MKTPFWAFGQFPQKGAGQPQPGSFSQEWSASTSKSPLLLHQSGHVSQFFDEWQFKVRGSGITPKEPDEFSSSLCDWGAVDSRTHTMVAVSRVYSRKDRWLCEVSSWLGIGLA